MMGAVTGAFAPSGAPAWAAMVAIFMPRGLPAGRVPFKRAVQDRKKAPGRHVRGRDVEAPRAGLAGGGHSPRVWHPSAWVLGSTPAQEGGFCFSREQKPPPRRRGFEMGK